MNEVLLIKNESHFKNKYKNEKGGANFEGRTKMANLRDWTKFIWPLQSEPKIECEFFKLCHLLMKSKKYMIICVFIKEIGAFIF